MHRFEDYIGQLEAATAIAGLAAAKGKAPGIKDRKEIAAIQEVSKLTLLTETNWFCASQCVAVAWFAVLAYYSRPTEAVLCRSVKLI